MIDTPSLLYATSVKTTKPTNQYLTSMSLELAFDLYAEIYEELFRYGVTLADVAKEAHK